MSTHYTKTGKSVSTTGMGKRVPHVTPVSTNVSTSAPSTTFTDIAKDYIDRTDDSAEHKLVLDGPYNTDTCRTVSMVKYSLLFMYTRLIVYFSVAYHRGCQ